MNADSTRQTPAAQPEPTNLRVKMLRNLLLLVGFLGAVLFITSGRLNWPQAWVFLLAYGGAMALDVLIVPKDPELMDERLHIKEDVPTWDRVFSAVAGIGMLAVLFVCGLDERWGWSPEIAAAIPWIGVVFVALGYWLAAWATATNRFFSRFVRIQKDRGQYVITDGPYRFVRHPGYVGTLLNMLAVPLALSSLWGLVPALLVALSIVMRTAREDQLLREELDGYTAYARRVRYRLFPGLW